MKVNISLHYCEKCEKMMVNILLHCRRIMIIGDGDNDDGDVNDRDNDNDDDLV